MSEIVEWLANQNIESYDVVRKDGKDFENLAETANCDLVVFWDKQNYKRLKFRILDTVWVDDDEIVNAGRSYQFLLVKSKRSIDQSRIYRRGTVMSYCNAVRQDPGPNKIRDERVNIAGMRHYITLKEFPALFSKLKLSGLEFTDEEFWKQLKFQRR